MTAYCGAYFPRLVSTHRTIIKKIGASNIICYRNMSLPDIAYDIIDECYNLGQNVRQAILLLRLCGFCLEFKLRRVRRNSQRRTPITTKHKELLQIASTAAILFVFTNQALKSTFCSSFTSILWLAFILNIYYCFICNQ